MINIQKIGNAIVIDFTDNDKYLHNGTIEVAPNELMVVIDESDMATFKKMSNGDTLFGQLINQIQIQGEAVTKDNIIDKFGMIGFTSGGGGGAVNSVNGQTGDVIITAKGLGAITKTDADAAYASKSELEEKQEVFQVNSPMAFNRDEATQDLHLSIDLSGYATKEELADKADTSTVESLSGIVANQSTDISNLYTQVNQNSGKIVTLNTKVNNKQDTLVSGTNIKTVNGQSLLGNGNIEIEGGGTVDSSLSTTSENPVQNKIITAALNGKQTAGDYALKSEAATKEELATTNAELEHKADKTSVYTKAEADNKLATKQATLIQGTNITLSEPNAEGKVTISASQPDITGLATKTELTEGLAGKQDKGNYALKSDLNTLATKEELATKADASALSSKQDTLVSGTNIKTINGETILGEGNLTIQGGSEPRTWTFTTSSSLTTGDLVTITPSGFTAQEWLSQVTTGDMVYLDKGQEFMKLSVSNVYHRTTGNNIVGLSFYSTLLYNISVTGSLFSLNINRFPKGKTENYTAIGQDADVTAASSYGVAIGYGVKANGYNAIAIGNNIQEDEQLSINIGDHLKVSYANGFSYWDGTQMQSLKDQLASLTPPTVDTAMSDTSENAVQNKVIKKYIDSLVGNILTQLQEINGTN